MPGVSVLTPKRGRDGSASARGGGRGKTPQQHDVLGWDSESEEGEGEGEMMGFSPPKTMQFHIPQGRLMRTPGTSYPAYISLPLSWSLFVIVSCSFCFRFALRYVANFLYHDI